MKSWQDMTRWKKKPSLPSFEDIPTFAPQLKEEGISEAASSVEQHTKVPQNGAGRVYLKT